MISVHAVRIITLIVCVAGIAGMIVTSVLNHNGVAITFGLVTTVAVLCSIVAKAVAADTAGRVAPVPAPVAAGAGAEALAAEVERHIAAAVASGATEATIRQLVGEAVRLGRALESERR